ncbi:MAG: hypothetical protein FP816_15145 [Desulfobacteraceae bacterium]|nr:hypothetical protein [Desulfobacteraceae bacterium]MBU4054729.1 hypothetical protein [Pseudomonadota bacterium]
MMKRLASIKLTFWNLIGLGLLLGSGAVLTTVKSHSKTMRAISEQLPLDWFSFFPRDDGLVFTWFLLTCLTGGLLFINILCCMGLRLGVLVVNPRNLRQWLFLLIHTLFAVVMACHGLSMAVGFKHSNIQLKPGQSFSFAPEDEIIVSEIVFKDNTDMLKADYQTRRTLMTRNHFHPDQNYARITFTRKDQPMGSGTLTMLSPFTQGDLQITLTDFLYDKDRPSDPLGVSLVVTKNPVVKVFFISYVLLIFALILFAFFTWKPNHDETRFILPIKY